MTLKFKRNRHGNYTAADFVIYKPKKRGQAFKVFRGSARRTFLGLGTTLKEAQATAQAFFGLSKLGEACEP